MPDAAAAPSFSERYYAGSILWPIERTGLPALFISYEPTCIAFARLSGSDIPPIPLAGSLA